MESNALPDMSMRGKNCLITGATAGIGKVTAMELASRGANIIIVGRNADKCEATLAEIEAQTGNTNLDFLTADLSDFQSVKTLAKNFTSKYSKLSVLVNNAGGIFMRRADTKDGLEMTWALNHFGYFWLTAYLIDELKASTPSRIINVSSDAHKRSSLSGPPNMRDKMPIGFLNYADTKLANLLFSYHLAYSIKSTGVTVNAMHPGIVATDFGSSNGIIGKAIQMNAKVFGVKPEQGARTIIQLASAPELYQVTGKYFVNGREVLSSKTSYDTKLSTKMWQWSVDVSRRLGMDTKRIEFLR
ncbi:SDR family oxidoreductase [soil metagenome]